MLIIPVVNYFTAVVFQRVGGCGISALALLGDVFMSDDKEYYRGRALAERALASDAKQANVAAIHEELARQYEALVDQVELRPRKRLTIAFRQNAA